jgi:hypothetical protein
MKPLAVTLAPSIHREHQCLFPVVERAEEDLHVVVAEDLIAVSERCRRPAVQLEGADAEVDRAGGVPDEHLRRVGGGHAVVGRVLREARQDRGVGPHRVLQVSVNERGGFEPRNLHVELPRAARVDAERVGGEGEGEGAVNQQPQCQQHVR